MEYPSNFSYTIISKIMSAHLSDSELASLTAVSKNIRKNILMMIHHAGSGHPGGSLGMTDIFNYLYFSHLKHDPKNPEWDERDRLILSNGHICPVWYATLAETGYFPLEELGTLRQLNSRLQGHPHLNLDNKLPGVENTSGPLGQGISQSVGLAIAFKMDKKENQVYCMSSDGEQQEGQTWESYLLAAKYKLDNLTIIIDRNQIQISGNTKETMPLEPLLEKIESFGWNVIEIDGHDFSEISNGLKESKIMKNHPTAIIAHTIPGKGVDFMENKYEWHGKAPNDRELEKALAQL